MAIEHDKYVITSAPNIGSMLIIKAKGKGSVPMVLRGMFTSTREAQKAIDTYNKEKANGKAKSTS